MFYQILNFALNTPYYFSNYFAVCSPKKHYKVEFLGKIVDLVLNAPLKNYAPLSLFFFFFCRFLRKNFCLSNCLPEATVLIVDPISEKKQSFRSSPPEVFLGKGILKIRIYRTTPCQSLISVKLLLVPAWCQLKSHTYLNKPAGERCSFV